MRSEIITLICIGNTVHNCYSVSKWLRSSQVRPTRMVSQRFMGSNLFLLATCYVPLPIFIRCSAVHLGLFDIHIITPSPVVPRDVK